MKYGVDKYGTFKYGDLNADETAIVTFDLEVTTTIEFDLEV